MPLTDSQKELLTKMVEPLIKKEVDSEVAKQAFHEYIVSKSRSVMEKSGDPLDNKPEDSRAGDGKEIKGKATGSGDPLDNKPEDSRAGDGKEIKGKATGSGDPLDNKPEASTAEDGKEIKA